MQLTAFDGPSRKPPRGAKNLPEISYASRVIAHLVTNFVAMATEVGRGKMQLAAFDGPFPKTSYRRKNLPKISYASRVIANFVPNIVAMATRVIIIIIIDNRGLNARWCLTPLLLSLPTAAYLGHRLIYAVKCLLEVDEAVEGLFTLSSCFLCYQSQG